jgi:hypothetical protein
MLKQRAGLAVLAGIAGIGVALLLGRWLMGGQSMKDVRRLRNQLTSPEYASLNSLQRERLVGDLMRKVDVLGPEQVRQLWRETGREYGQQMRESAATYHRLPESDRITYLDEELKRLEPWREVWRAVRTDSVFWPRRNRGNWRQRRGEGRDQRGARSDPESTRRAASTPDSGGRRGRGRWPPDRDARADEGPVDIQEQAELAAFLQALNTRCEERVLEPLRWGRRWRR